ncbi:acyltransferase family protein [Mucilaginibacter sp. McL0603]|uniref:acyltransferase family protein n=1 Tax=Mucilaginibacter sp. McL0603 TaxID=3415670 RepID=UPI003CF31B58
MELKYYKELDGLRGFAALIVVFFHFMPDASTNVSPLIHALHKLAVFGQTGVTLFFVLSGFLITRILLKAKKSKHYFRNFYVKRILRIFPLYYFALLIMYFVTPLFITNSPYSFKNSWMYWAYLQNISETFNLKARGPLHFWSLAVEEHFYLFWPIIVYYTTTSKLLRVIGGIIGVAFVCRYLLLHFGYGTFYFTFSVMDALAIGGFLAWYEARKPVIKLNFNLIIIVSLLLMIPTWLVTGGKGYDWVQIIKLPIISIFYMAIIGKLITAKSFLNSIFGSRSLSYIGKISYGLYVFHPLCFIFYYYYFPGNNIWINAICCFSISIIIATISFYGFEIHFLKLKRYFETAGWREKSALPIDSNYPGLKTEF